MLYTGMKPFVIFILSSVLAFQRLPILPDDNITYRYVIRQVHIFYISYRDIGNEKIYYFLPFPVSPVISTNLFCRRSGVSSAA